MSRLFKPLLSSALLSSMLLTASLLSAPASADGSDKRDHQGKHQRPSGDIVLYFTRHAEKQTALYVVETDAGMDLPAPLYTDNCNADRSRCEEELSELGSKRADLLAEWFETRGITPDISHVVSSDKRRTRTTVKPIANLLESDYGVTLPEEDSVDDGVWQLNAVAADAEKANETKGNSSSIAPTIAFIQTQLEMGDVAVIAGHSGTLYGIMAGLGIDVSDNTSFPKNAEGKIPGFGDVWKVVIRSNGTATLKWRKDVDFKRLEVIDGK